MGDKNPEQTPQELEEDRKMLRPLIREAKLRCQRRGVFVSLALELELEHLAHRAIAAERAALARAQAQTIRDPSRGEQNARTTPVVPADWTRPHEDE